LDAAQFSEVEDALALVVARAAHEGFLRPEADDCGALADLGCGLVEARS
jgi:hypothetical protein